MITLSQNVAIARWHQTITIQIKATASSDTYTHGSMLPHTTASATTLVCVLTVGSRSMRCRW